MLSPIAFCTECRDEFTPIEGRRTSDDPADQCNFCSDSCYYRYHDRIDAQSAYNEAGWAAPVW